MSRNFFNVIFARLHQRKTKTVKNVKSVGWNCSELTAQDLRTSNKNCAKKFLIFFFCLPLGFLPVVGPIERWCCLQHLARPCYVTLGRALICGWNQNLITFVYYYVLKQKIWLKLISNSRPCRDSNSDHPDHNLSNKRLRPLSYGTRLCAKKLRQSNLKSLHWNKSCVMELLHRF